MHRSRKPHRPIPRAEQIVTASEKPKQTKSRNGCTTCKAKRLKCDEAKPTCKQCQRRKVSCGGYKKHYKWRLFEESTLASARVNVSGTKTENLSSLQIDSISVSDCFSTPTTERTTPPIALYASNFTTSSPHSSSTDSPQYSDILPRMYTHHSNGIDRHECKNSPSNEDAIWGNVSLSADSKCPGFLSFPESTDELPALFDDFMFVKQQCRPNPQPLCLYGASSVMAAENEALSFSESLNDDREDILESFGQLQSEFAPFELMSNQSKGPPPGFLSMLR